MKMSEIIDMRNNGATYQEIADAVGLSKEWVRQLITKHAPELKGARRSARRRALEQVTRLQAEIERLSKELIKQQLKNNMLYETAKEAKSEAVKEFAERLKTKVNFDLCEAINCSDYLYDLPKLINHLVKEMTEQSTGYGSSKTEE